LYEWLNEDGKINSYIQFMNELVNWINNALQACLIFESKNRVLVITS
jgi:hypothetical protein